MSRAFIDAQIDRIQLRPSGQTIRQTKSGQPLMTPGDLLLLTGAGLGAGFVNGLAGGGSLVSYPALLAIGQTPIVANVTNTVGIMPGYLGGAAGFREVLYAQQDRVRQLAPVGLAGGIVGAALLVTTPPEVFEWIVPFLIAAACALFATQPLISRRVQARRAVRNAAPGLTWPTYAATFAASVYGGYFGAGLGIILLAALGASLPEPLPSVNSLRGVLSLMINVVAVLVFCIAADVAWGAAGVLAGSSLIGGYAGARTSLRLPTPVLRGVVLLFGAVALTRLLFT